jgi:hypothetical protein
MAFSRTCDTSVPPSLRHSVAPSVRPSLRRSVRPSAPSLLALIPSALVGGGGVPSTVHLNDTPQRPRPRSPHIHTRTHTPPPPPQPDEAAHARAQARRPVHRRQILLRLALHALRHVLRLRLGLRDFGGPAPAAVLLVMLLVMVHLLALHVHARLRWCCQSACDHAPDDAGVQSNSRVWGRRETPGSHRGRRPNTRNGGACSGTAAPIAPASGTAGNCV